MGAVGGLLELKEYSGGCCLFVRVCVCFFVD